MAIPTSIKIYHILHVDRLPSILADGSLWCDRVIRQGNSQGTTIGMSSIKNRRLCLLLSSHPGLHVGDCVPFYFCPRSVMLYLIYKGNHEELTYRGGQGPIVHLEASLDNVVAWANKANHNWAFTTSNAGSNYFLDYSDLGQLNQIDWRAVRANNWASCRENKQAEFLVEDSFPWGLVERIGVISRGIQNSVDAALQGTSHQPPVVIVPSWYYCQGGSAP